MSDFDWTEKKRSFRSINRNRRSFWRNYAPWGSSLNILNYWPDKGKKLAYRSSLSSGAASFASVSRLTGGTVVGGLALEVVDLGPDILGGSLKRSRVNNVNKSNSDIIMYDIVLELQQFQYTLMWQLLFERAWRKREKAKGIDVRRKRFRRSVNLHQIAIAS